MPRVLDVSYASALRAASIAPRNFVVVRARTLANDDAVFGFWDDSEAVTVSVVDPSTDSLVSHDFSGDGALVKVDTIPMRVGLEVRTINVVLSPLNPDVADMIRGHNVRLARVEIYRGLLGVGSTALVAPPRIRFRGRVNGSPITTSAAGSSSDVTLRVVSDTRELTRTSPAVKSDEQQKLRSGDRFRRYTGIVDEWPIWWGEESS